jgi:CheY-like chemotaxis protein
VEEQSLIIKGQENIPSIDTVLVVDDDEGWCFLSKKILERAGVGKKIITANNGQEAIKKLQHILVSGENMPELIFLDIKMPVMDGFEFLEEVTQSAELNLSQTKIFMCTSSILSKDKERAYNYPISGFITKPLTQEILKNILV